ncbi:MAG: hypothetical protein ACXVNM_09755 [Bacteroidia bacterium]
MYKLLRSKYTAYSELPLDEFNELNTEIYLFDFRWKCLFINTLAKCKSGTDKTGNNFMEIFPHLPTDKDFEQLKQNMESGIVTNFVTSSVANKKVNIVGFPLKDCFYISKSPVPDKDDLISELRGELVKMRN